MKSGDLTAGAAKLHKAWENLLIRWEETKLQWHDPVSQQFEENYLAGIQIHVESTLERMRTLASVFITAEQDCNS